MPFNPEEKRDEHGRWIVGYHGTDSDFKQFRETNDVGFHFGATPDVANERLKQITLPPRGPKWNRAGARLFTPKEQYQSQRHWKRAQARIDAGKLLEEGSNVRPVKIDAQRLLHLPDLGGSWDEEIVGAINEATGSKLRGPRGGDVANRQYVNRVLNRLGYHGIQYNNIVESPGGGRVPSYLITNSRRIRPFFKAAPMLTLEYLQKRRAGLAPRMGPDRTPGARMRRLGRARLFLAKALVLKDMDAGDVHISSAIGNDQTRRRGRKYPNIAFARMPNVPPRKPVQLFGQ